MNAVGYGTDSNRILSSFRCRLFSEERGSVSRAVTAKHTRSDPPLARDAFLFDAPPAWGSNLLDPSRSGDEKSIARTAARSGSEKRRQKDVIRGKWGCAAGAPKPAAGEEIFFAD